MSRGTDPISKFLRKFYATLIFEAIWLDAKIFDQSKCFKNDVAQNA